ncbi:MAG: glycosyltransferase family 4 protein [Balneolales bacterium]
MNILLIAQYYPPETGAGATRAEALTRYLSECGWEIDVISEIPNYPTGIVPEEYQSGIHFREKHNGTTVNRLWVWANKRETTLQQMGLFGSYLVSSMLYALLNPRKYDFVYATSPPIFSALSGCLIAKIYRIPFVLEIRDLWPDAAVGIGKITKRSYWYRFGKRLEHWLYKQADVIIPVTHETGAIIKKDHPGALIHVIQNGVDLEHFKPIANPEKVVDESFDDKKFRIGFVGSLGVIHDFKTVIEAAKLCEIDDDIEFVIIGDGSCRNLLTSLIEEHRPKNVIWLGLKDHEKIPAYISLFDVGINPVYDIKVFESIITVKFFEYLACEVPVISLARGVMQQEGDKSKAALTLEPENAELLANTIIELKKDPARLKSMKSHARSFIHDYYDRKKLTYKLSAILKDKFIDQPDK